MSLESIKEILNTRDGYDRDEAAREFNVMQNRVAAGEDPEDVLYEYGLEPDYADELIFSLM